MRLALVAVLPLLASSVHGSEARLIASAPLAASALTASAALPAAGAMALGALPESAIAAPVAGGLPALAGASAAEALGALQGAAHLAAAMGQDGQDGGPGGLARVFDQADGQEGGWRYPLPAPYQRVEAGDVPEGVVQVLALPSDMTNVWHDLWRLFPTPPRRIPGGYEIRAKDAKSAADFAARAVNATVFLNKVVVSPAAHDELARRSGIAPGRSASPVRSLPDPKSWESHGETIPTVVRLLTQARQRGDGELLKELTEYLEKILPSAADLQPSLAGLDQAVFLAEYYSVLADERYAAIRKLTQRLFVARASLETWDAVRAGISTDGDIRPEFADYARQRARFEARHPRVFPLTEPLFPADERLYYDWMSRKESSAIMATLRKVEKIERGAPRLLSPYLGVSLINQSVALADRYDMHMRSPATGLGRLRDAFTSVTRLTTRMIYERPGIKPESIKHHARMNAYLAGISADDGYGAVRRLRNRLLIASPLVLAAAWYAGGFLLGVAATAAVVALPPYLLSVVLKARAGVLNLRQRRVDRMWGKAMSAIRTIKRIFPPVEWPPLR